MTRMERIPVTSKGREAAEVDEEEQPMGRKMEESMEKKDERSEFLVNLVIENQKCIKCLAERIEELCMELQKSNQKNEALQKEVQEWRNREKNL